MSGSTLLLATSNPGKRAEFARLLPAHLSLVTLKEVEVVLPDEVGASFQEIAATKALIAATSSSLLTIADDSGLEVDALDGAPGLRTGRYAGEHASDAENRAKLLADLRHVPPEARVARFRCAIALAAPGEVLGIADGLCEGTIACSEQGGQGFGYDPLFLLPNGRTLAELSPPEKDRLSHRGLALAALRPLLDAALASAAGERQ